MSHRFTFNAYVLSVIDPRRICVRVDAEHVEAVTAKLTSAYDKTTFRDTILLGVADCQFDINIGWQELSDLIGVHIKVNAATRKYSYYKTKTTYDEHNNDARKTIIQCRGVAVSAKKITNKID